MIPRHLRTVEHDGQTFIELQDLLDGFEDPQVMDIKLGVRTFLESEVQNTTARQDLYKKVSTKQVTPNFVTKKLAHRIFFHPHTNRNIKCQKDY